MGLLELRHRTNHRERCSEGIFRTASESGTLTALSKCCPRKLRGIMCNKTEQDGIKKTSMDGIKGIRNGYDGITSGIRNV